MDTFFLIRIEGEVSGEKIQRTFGPYLSFPEASTIMLECAEALLEAEGITFTSPYKGYIVESLLRQGNWIDLIVRATDTPLSDGGRYYEVTS
jgi:hypothetical protein